MATFIIPTGEVTIEEGPINLDGYAGDPILVWAAVRFQPVKVARVLFPSRPKGYVSATYSIGAYAANLSAARSCRLRGDIRAAMVYETICDGIYNDLPDFARW